MTDDCAPHWAELVKADTGLRHLWYELSECDFTHLMSDGSRRGLSDTREPCVFVCRLISNQFTVSGIKDLAEALAHNTALQEIW